MPVATPGKRVMEEGRRLSACFSPRCCLGANAFEINDIQEDEV
jgi:hypothetical protein